MWQLRTQEENDTVVMINKESSQTSGFGSHTLRDSDEQEDSSPKKKRKIQERPEYNFTKFCYRHNPDIRASPTHTLCYKQDVKRVTEINERISQLPMEEQSEIHHIISIFKKSNDKLRKLILDGLLTSSCFPQLSYVMSQLSNIVKLDFISTLPQELSLKILSYLDCQSLCNAAKVCRQWQKLADDDRVWYHMCEQHIDKKCPNCGWGLPLLHMKRARHYPTQEAKKSWKTIYRERFKIESNWRRGHCQVQEFKGHMDGVLTLQFNHRVLFTGSYDSTVGMWDLYTGKLMRRLVGHQDGVKTLYFDDKKLITGSLDKTIRVWNYITGECISTYRGHTDSVLSVDSFKKIIVSGSADKTVKVWHLESRTCYTLRGHTEWVNCVKLHPRSFSCFSCSDDTTIRMWDIRTNKCLKIFRGHVGQVQKILPLTIVDVANLVTDTPFVCTNPREEQQQEEQQRQRQRQETMGELDDSLVYPTHLLSCSLDNTIKLWEVRTGCCVRTQFGHVEGVWDIAADNFRIVSGSHDGSVKVWDLQNGKCLWTFHGGAPVAPQDTAAGTTTTAAGSTLTTTPIACIGIGDSEFLSGDEAGCVKMYRFDI